MTLAEIRAMFKPGQVWIGKRTPGFGGEPTTITTRTVEDVHSTFVEYRVDGKPYRSDFPKARRVITARPGYLLFKLEGIRNARPVDLGVTIELILQE